MFQKALPPLKSFSQLTFLFKPNATMNYHDHDSNNAIMNYHDSQLHNKEHNCTQLDSNLSFFKLLLEALISIIS